MTTFTAGPAMGKTLMLRRNPIFLRVVIGPRGAIDALDQPDDEPRPDERLYAYRLARDLGSMHIRAGRGGRSGFYRMVEYAPVEPQPSDADMRTQSAWADWTRAAYAAEKGGPS